MQEIEWFFYSNQAMYEMWDSDDSRYYFKGVEKEYTQTTGL